jgi:hypothetical protein
MTIEAVLTKIELAPAAPSSVARRRRRLALVIGPLFVVLLSIAGWTVLHRDATLTERVASPSTPATVSNPRALSSGAPASAPALGVHLAVTQLPSNLVLVRSQTIRTPFGLPMSVDYFGPSVTYGSNVTASLTLGPGACGVLRAADQLAAAYVAAAATRGDVIPGAVHLTVNGAPGVTLVDPMGWREVSWAPDETHLFSVTGYRMSLATVLAIAAHVTAT